MKFDSSVNNKNSYKTTIAIVGLGYVGLTLQTVMAEVGFNTIGIDTDEKLVKQIKRGKPHFHEIGLIEMMHQVSKQDNAPQFFTSLKNVSAEIYIITVGTPIIRPSLEPNLEHVKRAAFQVGSVLKKGDLVILRSTVPVGTTRDIVLDILQKTSNLNVTVDFFLAFCPERTIEGKALRELKELPQIIGGIDEKSTTISSNIFSRITQTIIDLGSIEAAEMLKIMDNTYRDVMFAYANQVGMVCDALNIDMGSIVRAANSGYNRNNIPIRSPGVGGACLSKDPYIMANVCEKAGVDPIIFKNGRIVNEGMPSYVANKLFNKLYQISKVKKKKIIMILGFAFKGKPETSDMRDSPTISLVKNLNSRNVEIWGHDPLVSKKEIRNLGVKFVSVEQGFSKADGVLIMINHKSYEELPLIELVANRKSPILIVDDWDVLGKKKITDISNKQKKYLLI